MKLKHVESKCTIDVDDIYIDAKCISSDIGGKFMIIFVILE